MKKKLLILFISLVCLVCGAFALSACGGLLNPNNTNDSNDQSNTNQNNSTGNSANNNNTNNNTSNNNGDKEGLKNEFSSIVYKIITDDYYNEILDGMAGISHEITPKAKPIPYKFLRQHGHNVDAYLDGTLDVFASSYIYDNDKNHIYVSVKAENVSNSQYGNYYTNYVLKYPLTNQEYDEYTYMCKDEALQGLLFIQELDNQKTPEIVNEINIAVYSYNDMIKEFTKWDNVNVNKYYNIDIDIIEFNENEIIITSRGAYHSNYFDNTIGEVKITPTRYTGIDIYEDNVHYLANAYRVKFNHDEEYKSSLQDITSFSYGTDVNNLNAYPKYIK